ncbi:VOC family protein [Cohnella nanjingensis]|uniref:VOC family protein n=1 Tax=Cohnella nanjingensis TaxID=1387779 RepID=A0A7X0VCN0_9BACL|nr:VOC family protein [Cohnella nanjingensis]MBB6669097.1 VOC family protein [Cohnella nanjingensis]
MPLNAYLNFDGNTREVVHFYAQAFGIADPVIMTFGSMPADPAHPLPPGTEDLVMHAKLNIEGSDLMFSDVFPGMMEYKPGNNITISYVTKDEAALRNAFHKLKEGGSVLMELQETPWSKCYGQATDKFGIGWQFNLDNGES